MKKRPLLWIGIAILSLVALTIVLNLIGYLFHAWHFIQPGYGRGGGFHHGHMYFPFLPFLFHVGLIVLGWWIWKKANGETVKKWVGIILLTVGLFSILPLIVVVPVLLLAIYFNFKKKKSDSTIIDEPMIVTYPTYPTQTHDILDAWERQTNKEETK